MISDKQQSCMAISILFSLLGRVIIVSNTLAMYYYPTMKHY